MSLTVSNVTNQNLAVDGLYLTPGQSVTIGFLTAAVQNAINDGKLSSSGVAAAAPTQVSSALIDSTTGVVSGTNTIVVSPASYTPATDEANNATMIKQINNLVNDVAQLGNALNSIINAGNLSTKVQ